MKHNPSMIDNNFSTPRYLHNDSGFLFRIFRIKLGYNYGLTSAVTRRHWGVAFAIIVVVNAGVSCAIAKGEALVTTMLSWSMHVWIYIPSSLNAEATWLLLGSKWNSTPTVYPRFPEPSYRQPDRKAKCLKTWTFASPF